MYIILIIFQNNNRIFKINQELSTYLIQEKAK